MHKEHGFSMVELMLVVAILAIGAAVAIPSIFQWRTTENLRGSATNLRADLNMAKMTAVREQSLVVVNFFGGHYEMFVDNGAGVNTGNWILDSDERWLKNTRLPAGVSIDLAHTSFLNDRTRFNARGLPDQVGTVILVSSSGQQHHIGLNRMGRIDP